MAEQRAGRRRRRRRDPGTSRACLLVAPILCLRHLFCFVWGPETTTATTEKTIRPRGVNGGVDGSIKIKSNINDDVDDGDDDEVLFFLMTDQNEGR